jgi:hypothetical protein
VDHEFGKDAPEVTFVDRNQEVEALATYRSDESLAEGICGWRSDGRFQDAYPEAVQGRIYIRRKDGIAVVDQQTVGVIEG